MSRAKAASSGPTGRPHVRRCRSIRPRIISETVSAASSGSNRPDFSPRRRGGEHLCELRFALKHQVGELGGQCLALHAHATEFGHVNPEEVLVCLEVVESHLQIGTQLVPPGAGGAHGGSRIGVQPPGLFQKCREVNLFFGGEVEVKGALGDTGLGGDIVHYRICIALAGKHGPRGMQNRTAPLFRGQLATR